jgi:hypothetical protein
VDEAALSSPEVQRVVITQVYDLVALAIGPKPQAAVAAGRGAHAVRLHAIKMDINAHLELTTIFSSFYRVIALQASGDYYVLALCGWRAGMFSLSAMRTRSAIERPSSSARPCCGESGT